MCIYIYKYIADMCIYIYTYKYEYYNNIYQGMYLDISISWKIPLTSMVSIQAVTVVYLLRMSWKKRTQLPANKDGVISMFEMVDLLFSRIAVFCSRKVRHLHGNQRDALTMGT